MKTAEHGFYKQAIKWILPNQEIMRKQIISRPVNSRVKRHRWLIPVAACAATVTVMGTAVPPVRAAILQWFQANFSVQDYLAEPSAARPSTSDLDSLIQQAKPAGVQAANSIDIADVDPAWQSWADSLHPTVGDVFFDGKQLMVSFDMGGGAEELLKSSVSPALKDQEMPRCVYLAGPGYVKMNGEKFAYDTFSHPSESAVNNFRKYYNEDDTVITQEEKQKLDVPGSVTFTATTDFSKPGGNYIPGFDKLAEEQRALILQEIQQQQVYDPEFTFFDFKTLNPEQTLTGVQKVELNIPLFATDTEKPAGDGANYASKCIAVLKLRFSFDPQAGNDHKQSYGVNKTVVFSGMGRYKWVDRQSEPGYATCTNKVADMSGVKLTVKKMDVYASGTDIYLSYTCPADWDTLDKQCFLNSITLKVRGDGTDLQISEEQFGLEEKGEDVGECIRLNILPYELKAIKTFEVLPVLSYYTGYDAVPYQEGKSVRIKASELKGWQEGSTQLADCALTFSLE